MRNRLGHLCSGRKTYQRNDKLLPTRDPGKKDVRPREKLLGDGDLMMTSFERMLSQKDLEIEERHKRHKEPERRRERRSEPEHTERRSGPERHNHKQEQEPEQHSHKPERLHSHTPVC